MVLFDGRYASGGARSVGSEKRRSEQSACEMVCLADVSGTRRPLQQEGTAGREDGNGKPGGGRTERRDFDAKNQYDRPVVCVRLQKRRRAQSRRRGFRRRLDA